MKGPDGCALASSPQGMPEPCPGPCLSYRGPRRMGAASGLLDWWGAGLWSQQAVMLGVPWLRPQAQCRCQACVPQPSLRGVTAGRQRSAVLRSQDHRSPQAARKARISSPNTPPGRGRGGGPTLSWEALSGSMLGLAGSTGVGIRSGCQLWDQLPSDKLPSPLPASPPHPRGASSYGGAGGCYLNLV